jgi:hypothetical protein
MVSGSPEKELFNHAIAATLRFGGSDPETVVSQGSTIPEAWEREWAVALGKDPEEFAASVRPLQDTRLTRRGLQAYATACHNQFVAPRAALLRALEGEWTGRLMGGLNELDNRFDALGYLRLTTIDRTTRLIGNVLGPEILAEAKRHGLESDSAGQVRSARPSTERPWTARLLRAGPLRRILQGIYNRLFWLLSGQSTSWLETEDSGDGTRAGKAEEG